VIAVKQAAVKNSFSLQRIANPNTPRGCRHIAQAGRVPPLAWQLFTKALQEQIEIDVAPKFYPVASRVWAVT
jgi:hypothetical protein